MRLGVSSARIFWSCPAAVAGGRWFGRQEYLDFGRPASESTAGMGGAFRVGSSLRRVRASLLPLLGPGGRAQPEHGGKCVLDKEVPRSVIRNVSMSTKSEPHPPHATPESAGRYLWCSTCRSDRHLKVLSTEPHRPPETMLVEVTYTCRHCGNVFGHTATVEQVAAVVNRATNTTAGALRLSPG